MLARNTTLRHPSGVILETPLLVPAFSSKGFGFDKKNKSEVTEAFEMAKEYLYESMLISAYDIFYEHIPKQDRTPVDITFVDSGGYETADMHDSSSVYTYPWPRKDWDEKKLRSVYDSWSNAVPAVFVSYDHGCVRKPLKEQLESATELLVGYPDQLHDLILKPEKYTQKQIKLPNVIGIIDELRQFDIIGVTEKELGNSLLARMVNIAKLRHALNEAKITTPIQIFGSLDPMTSCLYFLSGAEIFDGLTWLRYAYRDGTAIYQANYGTLMGLQIRDTDVKATVIRDNVYCLSNLKVQMKSFLLENDFSKFKPHADLLEQSYDALCSKLGGRW